jgi:hypothetical protein
MAEDLSTHFACADGQRTMRDPREGTGQMNKAIEQGHERSSNPQAPSIAYSLLRCDSLPGLHETFSPHAQAHHLLFLFLLLSHPRSPTSRRARTQNRFVQFVLVHVCAAFLEKKEQQKSQRSMRVVKVHYRESDKGKGGCIYIKRGRNRDGCRRSQASKDGNRRSSRRVCKEVVPRWRTGRVSLTRPRR